MDGITFKLRVLSWAPTPVAPSYVNIFMGMFELKIYAQPHHGIWEKSCVRYIDNILFIWSKSPHSLTRFQTELKLMHPTIKFIFSSSQSKVHFLDALLTLQNNRLETELYTKPTDTHSYLLPSSSHPRQTITSRPYSQAIGVRRLCSTKRGRRNLSLPIGNTLHCGNTPWPSLHERSNKPSKTHTSPRPSDLQTQICN